MSGAQQGTGPDDRGLSAADLFEEAGARPQTRAGGVVEGPPMRRWSDPPWEIRRQWAADVMAKLDYHHDRRGNPTTPRASVKNLRRILARDEWFRSRVCVNGLSERVEWMGKPLRDEDVTDIQVEIEEVYGVEYGHQKLDQGLKAVGRTLKYHPVREYLRALRWDGVPRIDGFLVDQVGAADTPLSRAISRRWFVSCVARGMAGGEKAVKVDTVLILHGTQGKKKSWLFRALAGEDWFSDTKIDIRNKDALLAIRGKWIYELAELASTRSREQESVKAFITAQTDNFRPPYGRNNIDSHRQVVFVGTTNEDSFLSDPTGDRRYWPVSVGVDKIDLEAVRAMRDQLWAEAVVAWQKGEQWWLSDAESVALNDAQEVYRHEDPWSVAIDEWLAADPQNRVTAVRGMRVGELLGRALQMEKAKQGKHDEMRMGGVLQGKGWTKRRATRSGVRMVMWFAPEDGTP